MTLPRAPLFLLIFLLGACATNLPGEYELQSIDDEPLPALFMGTEIIAADIRLNGDGTCLITSTERDESGVVGSGTDENCTWVLDDAEITVTDSNAPLTGTVDDDGLTLTAFNGAVFGLTRR